MISSSDLCEFFDGLDMSYKHNGVYSCFSGCASLDDAFPTSVCWSKDLFFNLDECPAATLILPAKSTAKSNDKAVYYVDNPRLAYARLVREFFLVEDSKTAIKGFIHGSSTVSEGLKLGRGSSVGPGCVIGSNVTILENVVVHSDTKIGNNVLIKSGAVIGSSGFGFVENEKNQLEHFPHVGCVILKDNVEIGANSCVDRATLGETVVGENTKVSNLCQIAHNVVIGKRCLITGKSQVGGGTIVGDDVYVGPSAIISNKIKVGDKADIKIGSVVIENVLAGESVSGNFAMPHKKNLLSFIKAKKNR